MGDDGEKRISDLAFFLIFAGVLGTLNWVRNGPAQAWPRSSLSPSWC